MDHPPIGSLAFVRMIGAMAFVGARHVSGEVRGGAGAHVRIRVSSRMVRHVRLQDHGITWALCGTEEAREVQMRAAEVLLAAE